MAAPFFSIIVPIRGRHFLLRDTILSVLLQDFGDFELIASDNFNDEKVKRVLDEFLGDPRVKYLRTPRELCMLDHFEFASTKVTGKYVLFVGNRSLLMRGALKKIHQVIQNSPEDVLMWTWQHLSYDEDTGFMRATSKALHTVEFVESQKLLEYYRNVQTGDYRFPVVLHACYKRELAERIRKDRGVLFAPLVPEGTPLFLMLHYGPKVGVIHEPFLLERGEKYSTGNFTDTHGNEPYLRTLPLKEEEWFRHVPIKNAPFNHNLFVEDYLAVKKLLEGKYDFTDENWVTYFVRCYEDFLYFDFYKKNRERFLGPFETALASFGKGLRRKVRLRIFKRRFVLGTKAFLRKTPFLFLLRRIQNRLQYGYANKYYKTALEAAGFPPEAGVQNHAS